MYLYNNISSTITITNKNKKQQKMMVNRIPSFFAYTIEYFIPLRIYSKFHIYNYYIHYIYIYIYIIWLEEKGLV